MNSKTERRVEMLEASLRRKAKRAGLALRKCRARDPQNPAFGTYGLLDRAHNSVALSDGTTGYGVSLEQVGEYLNDNALNRS